VVSVAAVLFTAWTPIYATITAVCTIFLYRSYVIPIGLGCRAIGTRWTRFGPWNLGRWYFVLAMPAILSCVILVLIGMQPPNQKSVLVLGLFTATLGVCWWAGDRNRFAGPPVTTIR
jgi:hypothetical protein